MCSNDQRYNLLDEKWLPVLTLRGKNEKLGIIETLEQAASIRQIAPSNPMDRFAVFRFLLAVCYWCADRTKVPFPMNGNKIPIEWIDFLKGQHACFNLLRNEKRFYQVKDIDRTKPITELMQEIPTGNNFDFYRHDVHESFTLCPSCCSLGLLRLPLFSVSGLPNLKAGINGAPPVYVAPWGKTLLDTLQLNFRSTNDIGSPVWETSTYPFDTTGKVSLLAGLTAPARRVWLHDPIEDKTSMRCSCCGEESPILIAECEFESAGMLQTEEWTDPHVIYIVNKSGKCSSLSAANPKPPGKFVRDRATYESWLRNADTRAITLFAVGLSTKNADYADVWENSVTIPVSTSEEEMREIWDKVVYKLSAQIDYCINGKTERKISKAPARTAFISLLSRPHVEEQVANHITDLLSGNGSYTLDDAADEYAPFMKATAESLAPDMTVRDARKRREIKRLRPRIPKEDK